MLPFRVSTQFTCSTGAVAGVNALLKAQRWQLLKEITCLSLASLSNLQDPQAYTNRSRCIWEQMEKKLQKTVSSYQKDFDCNFLGNSSLCLACSWSNKSPSGIKDESKGLDALFMAKYCIKKKGKSLLSDFIPLLNFHLSLYHQ